MTANKKTVDAERPGCRECGGADVHTEICDRYVAGMSRVLDSERGHMAQAGVESLDRARMEADGITDEDIWETRTTPDWRLE